MIGFIFKITSLQKKKLIEIFKQHYPKSIVKVTKKNMVIIGLNLFNYIFNPKKIDIISLLQSLYPSTSFNIENLGETIDSLYKEMLLQEYSLSLTNPIAPTLTTMLMNKGEGDSTIVEKYSNLLYKYIVNNYNELELAKANIFKVVTLTTASNTRRIVLLIKDNIIHEISQLRSPPNSVCQRLFDVA